MKILITGAEGQLGRALHQVLKQGAVALGRIDRIYSSTEVIGTNSTSLDVTHQEAVASFIQDTKPDIIINTAGYTDVDGCETHQERAFHVNALGARNVAMAAEQVCAKMVQISTDYVFGGNAMEKYTEYDVPFPINTYGKTKLLGERYVRDFCSRFFIIRTSWLYSKIGKNFVKAILHAASQNEQIKVVEDQRGNPTHIEDLVFYLFEIMKTEAYGIYHCSGNGTCSRYDFAKKIVEYAGLDCTVTPIQSHEIQNIAKRPFCSALDHMMLRCTFGDRMRPWEEALAYFIKEEYPINKRGDYP